MQPFLQEPVVLGDELQILLELIGRDVLQLGENFLHARRANAREDAILLQNFAAHVEREILAVDDATHEAQIRREKLLGIVCDEDALYIELHAHLVLRLIQIERSFGGNIEERSVLEASFGLGMEPEERVLRVAGDRLIQLFVVVLRQLTLRPAPERARSIHLLGDARLLRLLLLCVPLTLVVGQEDGEGDVVGVLLYDLLQAPTIGIVRALFVEMQENRGAGDGALRGLDVEAGLAVAGPAPRLLFAGLARDDLDAVGDHEGAVEADAELADEVRILPGVAGELGEEVFGSGASNGAEVRDQVLFVHADAGVGEGEGLLLFVELEVDAGRERQCLVGIIGQRQMAQLIEGIGGVRNQLAQEDFRMRV